MNALILAAGLGTRLGTLTADRPKALVKIEGRTMLEHQLLHLQQAGFNHIAINIHHFGNMVRQFLTDNGNFGMDILISDETDLLLDTGGGIRKAMKLFTNDNPVLVHNVDIFSDTDLSKLYKNHLDSHADATLLVAERETSRHLFFDQAGMLRGWNNNSNGSIRSPYSDFRPADYRPAAFQGIHVISQSLLPVLDNITQQVFSITDFYVDHAAQLSLRAVFAPDSSQWVDAGKPESLLRAADIINKNY